jgi:hypothetical protein
MRESDERFGSSRVGSLGAYLHCFGSWRSRCGSAKIFSGHRHLILVPFPPQIRLNMSLDAF